MNMHVGGASKFKVGDRVRCIDAGCAATELTTGAVYQVSGFNLGDIRLEGVRSSWRASRFELVVAPFKVGDKVRVVRHCNWTGDAIPMGVPTGEVRQIVEKTDQLAKEGVDTFSLEGDGRFFYTPLNLELATLTIEAGKFYQTRDGRKVGPIAVTRYTNGSGNSSWPFTVGLKDFWTASGKACWSNIGGEASSEIIAEWIDEPAAKFKIGDKVGCTTNRGATYVIKAVDGGKVDVAYVMDSGEEGSHVYRDQRAAIFFAKPTSIADIVAKHSQAGTAIVCLLENGQPKPSTLPYVHASRTAAATEASRLAGIHKGSEFGVYECVDVRKVQAPVYDYEWQRLAAGGQKLLAIKELRGMTGLGLATARAAVEDWLRRAA